VSLAETYAPGGVADLFSRYSVGARSSDRPVFR
jgi:hypothetical protein